MPEPTTVIAESSSAPAAKETAVRFDGWDEKGTPIVKAKSEVTPKQESAPADPPKAAKEEASSEAKAETAAESDPAHKQEKGSKAEQRIKELLAENKRLKLERDTRQPEPAKETKAESSPAKAAEKKGPGNYSEWLDSFDEQKFVKDWMEKNPGKSYERALMAMTDHQYEIRTNFERSQAQQRAQQKAVADKLAEGKKTYPDFEDKAKGATDRILADDVPIFMKAFISESEVMEHLVYALAGGPLEGIIELSKSNPGKALRALRDLESDTEKALKASKTEKSEEKPESAEKAAEKTPVETKPRAPKPPSEVGGRGTAPEDVRASSARAGNFSSFEAEENRRKFVPR